MIKMPCLFVRQFHGDRNFTLTEQITPGCEWVFEDKHALASRKWDGTACMFQDGELFKRYDAKVGKEPPQGAIPCVPERDPVTGHWPHWVRVTEHDRWHLEALKRQGPQSDGTYELCGPRVNGNPEGLPDHVFLKHGEGGMMLASKLFFGRGTPFDHVRADVFALPWEGIVFSHPDGRFAKIRRKDFGFEWPVVMRGAI